MKGGKRGRHDFPKSLREAGGGVCVCACDKNFLTSLRLRGVLARCYLSKRKIWERERERKR